MRLKGKRALITGGGRGIGRAIAREFAKEGADIIITYANDQVAAEKTVLEITSYNRQAKAIQLNFNNPIQIETIKGEILDFIEKIDILVNNAGFLTRRNFLDITHSELLEAINVNLTGPFLLMQQIAELMKREKKGGSIINISSISDRIASTGLTHYQCAKAGISMLTKGAALELSQYGIRVNTLAPGLTATDINREQWEKQTALWQSRVNEIPLKRAGTPEDYVGAAIFLASDESAWMTGACIVIDGGRAIF